MAKYSRPEPGEYAPYYGTYIDKVDTDNILAHLKTQGLEIMYFLRALSEEQGDLRYEPGKWSVKEVVGHLIDTERLFAFRGLWFARGDQQAQPGMDENAWAAASNAGKRSWPELWREQHVARTDHVYLLKSFDPAAAARGGTASGHHLTVRAIPWIIAGHERHHLDILYTRYGLKSLG
jgi:hypothetical protein